MIVLGKDKVDERFNILADGTIVDLNGNVQEVKIAKGRSYFKSVAVYQIQMWTNFGWRDTKIWDIHHLDKNPLNNSLSNLIYLTHSEHMSLHNKGKKYALGYHHSEDSRKKMSNSMKGNKNPNFGKHHSEEIKQKISDTMKGNHHSEETKRKMSESHKGKHWTLSEETKRKLSEANKGKHWFNDGVKNYMCRECPPGCVKGRLI